MGAYSSVTETILQVGAWLKDVIANTASVPVSGTLGIVAGIAPLSLADVTATGSAIALGSLPAGPQGILVTAHPGNPAGSVVRISGSDVGTGQGQPLGPGASYCFQIDNANRLKVIIESGSAPKVCVSAV